MVRSLTLPDHFSGFKLAVDKIETKHEGSGLLHTLYINLQHETSSHEIPGKIALRMVPAIDGASGTIAFDFPDRPLVIFDSLNSPNIFRASLGTAISKELAKLAKVPVAAPLITVLSRFEKEIQAVIKETGVAFELKDVDLRLKGPVTLDSEAMKVQVRLRASPYVAVDARVASWLGCSALEPDTNFLRDYTIMSDRLKADYPKADHLILRPRPADLSDSSATLPSVSLAEPLRVYDCVAVEGKDYKWCRVGSNTEKGWVNAFYLTPGKLRTCPM